MGSFNKVAMIPINSAIKTDAAWGANNTAYMFASMVHRYTMPSLGTGGRDMTECKIVVRGTKVGIGAKGTMEACCTDNPNLLPNQYASAFRLGSLYGTWWGPALNNGNTGDNYFPVNQNLAALSGFAGTWYLILNFDGYTTFEALGTGTRVEGTCRDGSMRVIVGGVERLGEPCPIIGGVERRGTAYTIIGGVERLGT